MMVGQVSALEFALYSTRIPKGVFSRGSSGNARNSLTTAAQLQTYFRKLEGADRKEVIDAARGNSKRELEAMLLARTPEELRPALRPEKVRQVAPDAQEVRLVLDAELQGLLARFREVQGEASLTHLRGRSPPALKASL